MRKVLIESAVDMLLDNYNDELYRETCFWRTLENFIVDEEVDLLGDMELLASVMKKKETGELLDIIKFFNIHKGSELERLLG
ncbi:hypothetical protein P4534_23200 [Peribacillus butanolivorans]|uniref:hypothetical protein n=1 Tax=Peribacillus butanolivorans TaxID=421767 RepID=UPI002E1F7613|nr:hypothetical protein [Peribacillus butanolivorans]